VPSCRSQTHRATGDAGGRGQPRSGPAAMHARPATHATPARAAPGAGGARRLPRQPHELPVPPDGVLPRQRPGRALPALPVPPVRPAHAGRLRQLSRGRLHAQAARRPAAGALLPLARPPRNRSVPSQWLDQQAAVQHCSQFIPFSGDRMTEGALKESLYGRIIDLYDQGKLWEKSLEICSELRSRYEAEVNYAKLEKLMVGHILLHSRSASACSLYRPGWPSCTTTSSRRNEPSPSTSWSLSTDKAFPCFFTCVTRHTSSQHARLV